MGGRGLFAHRPQDRFGLGVFYWNFSDELQSTVNPIIDFGNGSGLEAYYIASRNQVRSYSAAELPAVKAFRKPYTFRPSAIAMRLRPGFT